MGMQNRYAQISVQGLSPELMELYHALATPAFQALIHEETAEIKANLINFIMPTSHSHEALLEFQQLYNKNRIRLQVMEDFANLYKGIKLKLEQA